jgi:hypothetical protein
MKCTTFLMTIGFGLVWSPAGAAAGKTKPPAISVCTENICLDHLHWTRPGGVLDMPAPAIEGILINNSNETLTSLSVQLNMEAGPTMVGTAVDTFTGELSPGQQWRFTAYILERSPAYLSGKTESGAMHCSASQSGVTRFIATPLHFDPLFDPYLRGEIKKWEKVHGKRQR